MRIALLVLGLAACAGDEVDMGNGPVCTTALYDNCLTEHDCASGDCHYFMGDDFNACTQACSASNPCPNDPNGQPVTCNNMGICKPAAATDCRVLH